MARLVSPRRVHRVRAPARRRGGRREPSGPGWAGPGRAASEPSLPVLGRSGPGQANRPRRPQAGLSTQSEPRLPSTLAPRIQVSSYAYGKTHSWNAGDRYRKFGGHCGDSSSRCRTIHDE